MRFRATPELKNNEVRFTLVNENRDEEQYFVSTFGGISYHFDLTEVVLCDRKGGKLIIDCTTNKFTTPIGNGYIIVYKPEITAIIERPVVEGAVEQPVAKEVKK
jgi:hypothetical protein